MAHLLRETFFISRYLSYIPAPTTFKKTTIATSIQPLLRNIKLKQQQHGNIKMARCFIISK